MIATYIGLFAANIPRKIEMIPINRTSIDVNEENLVILDNNPFIPNIIMINPTRKNWIPVKKDNASM